MSSTPLIRPFAALRPHAEHAADVIAPPYDVVTTDEARALAAGRPWSFLHISRPEIDLPAGTSPYADSAYARGAANLSALRERGILVRDGEPSLYIYRLRMNGHTQTGVAFVASVAAYEAHRIRRHELTRPDKENDRVKNIAALNAQTGPVLLAHRANESIATLLRASVTTAPLFEVPGPNGTLHAVWQVAAPERIAAFLAAFDALDALYIADGHHRSAAAARIAAERREQQSSSPTAFASHDYFLAVSFPHDEMRILGYHRVVRDLRGSSPAAFLERLGETFAARPSDEPVEPDAPRSFGMFLDGRWYALTLRSELVPPDDPVASLDVSVLQDRVLGPLLGIGDPRTDPRVDFVGGARGLPELERRVGKGAAAVAFSMYPTRMSELMAVADAGRLMPPKSTWFEPKLADGLLSHVLD